jgi:hypothetical protein
MGDKLLQNIDAVQTFDYPYMREGRKRGSHGKRSQMATVPSSSPTSIQGQPDGAGRGRGPIDFGHRKFGIGPRRRIDRNL